MTRAWLWGMVVLGTFGACCKTAAPPAQPAAPSEGEEASDEAGADESPAPAAEGGATPDDYDAVQRFFAKRRVQVARCYGDALVAGVIDKKAKGSITFEMQIDTSGRVDDIKVVKDSLDSEAVADCAMELILAWELPKPAGRMPFSFAYDFEAE